MSSDCGHVACAGARCVDPVLRGASADAIRGLMDLDSKLPATAAAMQARLVEPVGRGINKSPGYMRTALGRRCLARAREITDDLTERELQGLTDPVGCSAVAYIAATRAGLVVPGYPDQGATPLGDLILALREQRVRSTRIEDEIERLGLMRPGIVIEAPALDDVPVRFEQFGPTHDTEHAAVHWGVESSFRLGGFGVVEVDGGYRCQVAVPEGEAAAELLVRYREAAAALRGCEECLELLTDVLGQLGRSDVVPGLPELRERVSKCLGECRETW